MREQEINWKVKNRLRIIKYFYIFATPINNNEYKK